jgi:hypothetical protein
MPEADRPSTIGLVAAWLTPLWTTLLIAGGYSAAFGWRPEGALLMLAGFLGQVAGHAIMGLTEYRRVMRRSWPDVRPLEDDDDEW